MLFTVCTVHLFSPFDCDSRQYLDQGVSGKQKGQQTLSTVSVELILKISLTLKNKMFLSFLAPQLVTRTADCKK